MRTEDGFYDLIKALTILSRYAEGYTRKFPTHCEHDVMYVGVDPSKVSQEDLTSLESLGFTPDKESGGFSSFRFGSA